MSGRVLGPGVSRRKRSGMIVLRRKPISETVMYSRHGGGEIRDPGMLLFLLICWTLDAAQVRLRYVVGLATSLNRGTRVQSRQTPSNRNPCHSGSCHQ